jgi:hypothetical protein
MSLLSFPNLFYSERAFSSIKLVIYILEVPSSHYEHGRIRSLRYFFPSSGITLRGETETLPQFSSTALSPTTYVFSSSQPCSSDFLNWLKSPHFRYSCGSSAFWYKKTKLHAMTQLLDSKELSQPPPSFYFYHFVCSPLQNV